MPNDADLLIGMLERPDGASIYWERYGKPGGTPALFLHGGPGSGIGHHYRTYFDPAKHLTVTLDQRGCGRSRPLASEDLVSLASNTTQSLIDDIEALREHLGIATWLVVGLSWGATLGLAYAEAHPHRVTGLVLGAVTTTSRAEVEWITEDLRRVFPEEWDELDGAAGRRLPGERLIDALHRGIIGEDLAARERVAVAWGRWEDTHVSLASEPDPRWRDPEKRRLLATLVLHYWKHHAFLGDSGIMDSIAVIGDIPGVLIHGRLDISSTLSIPRDLHKRWPASKLMVIDGEGHFGERLHAAVKAEVQRLADELT